MNRSTVAGENLVEHIGFKCPGAGCFTRLSEFGAVIDEDARGATDRGDALGSRGINQRTPDGVGIFNIVCQPIFLVFAGGGQADIGSIHPGAVEFSPNLRIDGIGRYGPAVPHNRDRETIGCAVEGG